MPCRKKYENLFLIYRKVCSWPRKSNNFGFMIMIIYLFLNPFFCTWDRSYLNHVSSNFFICIRISILIGLRLFGRCNIRSFIHRKGYKSTTLLWILFKNRIYLRKLGYSKGIQLRATSLISRLAGYFLWGIFNLF